MIFLELNEFNEELLAKGARELKLANIARLLALKKCRTYTEDTYESDFLEPWVQWVSVHTGRSSAEHHIKHLGDVPDLKTPQIWEELSKKGITSGVWGAMNASRKGAENCLFFIPDPWTASERAYPEELNDLLEPLRYFSQNYTNRTLGKSLNAIKKLWGYLGRHHILGALFKEAPGLIKGKPYLFISLLDYLSTLLFLDYRKRYKTEFSLIFLNSIAHLQHHHWHTELGAPLTYGFRFLDRILGKLFDNLEKDEIIIVCNALSQKNTNTEKPWILYRQIDHKIFLDAIGIGIKEVHPLMTHDAHILFESHMLCTRAASILKEASVEGQSLFLVETYPDDPCRLFYRLAFTDAVTNETTFTCNGRTLPFLKYFKAIIERTGKHIPEGVLFTNDPDWPKEIKNHEIFQALISFSQRS